MYKTILYHHIFQFPLTQYETWKYLVDEPAEQSTITTALDSTAILKKSHNTYHLRSSSISVDKTNRTPSWNVITHAQKTMLPIARYIPSIECIGITGSIAALNETPKSDIDVLIICKPHTAWLTRLLVIGILSLMQKRSSATSRITHKMFCANMFLETSDLSIKKQNLFTAMELAHLKPIFNKSNTFQKLIQTNSWIKNFLPNFYSDVQNSWDMTQTNGTTPNQFVVAGNRLAKLLQQTLYRIRHKKLLTLESTWITDYQQKILETYKKLCTEHGVNKTLG
ncbi:hypothetical protein CO180_02460 [candidate division WWE3 bacterium CG_4_9_14_3_um_filter_41_6]|nr:MAG: hypothetical protein CO180_02460 [candidate division WWE3 bacterium CG_4_9_14_3_um_filter_41_6]